MAPHQAPLMLPKAILNQLGVSTHRTHGRTVPRPSTRKELRKIARKEHKPSRHTFTSRKRIKLEHVVQNDEATALPLEGSFPSSNNVAQPSQERIPRKFEPRSSSTANSDLKKRRTHRSVSPPGFSKAILDQLAEDDKQIAALEKKLKINSSKKLPKSFKDDGLDVLLEGFNEANGSDLEEIENIRSESADWLRRKRMKACTTPVNASRPNDTEQDVASSTDLSDTGREDYSTLGLDENTLDTDSFSGFESEKSLDTGYQRENPYVAPTNSSQKYVPPSLRNTNPSDSEELVRLRRRTQGLLNRLTESNLISILGDIEGLYRGHPRGHVTSILVDTILASISEQTSLPDTLIILPAGLIAAVYKVIGADFGAQVVQRIVELFDEHYSRASALSPDNSITHKMDNSKETSNLIMLLAEMFNFQVVASNLIFDYIRLFLGELSELNVELLLKIIRTSGPQLRQDDPSALNDIVAILRPATINVGEKNISVRTKFMIETIENLKNNRKKTGLAPSAVTSEHTIRMKKILGTLNRRSIKATEPLRMRLKDIQESDKKGKWWLVGASWSGKTSGEIEDLELDHSDKNMLPTEDSESLDLLQLAQEQRMNTDVRRAIFVTIMSATDFQDAYIRLMKLKLKKAQEFQIPKVLIHCAAMEKSYNHYYTLVAQKFCSDKKLKVSFQYCLWDIFKQMGESEDADPNMDEEENLNTRNIVNIAKMFGTLLAEGTLGLAVLKNLNLSCLQPRTTMFVEVLLITVLLQSGEDERLTSNIFSTAHGISHLITGLQYFLRKFIRRSDIAGGKQAKKTIKHGYHVAVNVLQRLQDTNV